MPRFLATASGGRFQRTGCAAGGAEMDNFRLMAREADMTLDRCSEVCGDWAYSAAHDT